MRKAATSSFRAKIAKQSPRLLKEFIKKLLGIRNFINKAYMAYVLPFKHDRLLKSAKGDHPIRVSFIASNFASWKVDQLVALMQSCNKFEITIVIARLRTNLGNSISEHEHRKLLSHFKAKGFSVLDTYAMSDSELRKSIQEIDPHVLVITNPHTLISKSLHQELFTKKLTCYVPYHHEVVAYGDNSEQYDQVSHNAFWRVFAPHQTSKEYYKKIRLKGDRGVVVTGLPACEPLFNRSQQFHYHWKNEIGEKLRIIWAPHWLIRPDLKLATIYELGEGIKDLASQYRDRVEWVLRPHPFLKPTLEKHPNWGKAKTEAFFKFWAESDFTQIEEGDYIDLFQTSDAMIHDSGSFLAEYLCVDKPVMYLKTEATAENYLNTFGQLALSACEVGRTVADIENFINRLLDGSDLSKDRRKAFLACSMLPLYSEDPSRKICRVLFEAFRKELADTGDVEL